MLLYKENDIDCMYSNRSWMFENPYLIHTSPGETLNLGFDS